MTSLTAFHPFSGLPAEIRIIIWEFSLSDCRVLNLWWKPARDRYPHPQPSLQLVNHEARTVMLRHYSWYQSSAIHGNCAFSFWCDPARDIIYFVPDTNDVKDNRMVDSLYHADFFERLRRRWAHTSPSKTVPSVLGPLVRNICISDGDVVLLHTLQRLAHTRRSSPPDEVFVHLKNTRLPALERVYEVKTAEVQAATGSFLWRDCKDRWKLIAPFAEQMNVERMKLLWPMVDG